MGNNMQDFTTYTLGTLLSHSNEIIRRNATSIIKTLQKQNNTLPPNRQ